MRIRTVSVARVAVLIASMAVVGAVLSPADAVPPGANGKIAFNFNDSGGIIVMNANGTNPVQIGGDGEIYPSWSPDSSRIAFQKNLGTGGSGLNYEIYTMNPDGTNKIRLTNTATGVNDSLPAWSPNGAQIAFTSNRTGNLEIWLMNADGTNPVQLTGVDGLPPIGGPDGPPQPSGFDRFEPAWSPDGSKIAYTSEEEGDGTEIFVMNADGTNPVSITDDPRDDFEPSWSPDGTKIAFAARDDDFTQGDVWVMNTDGTNPVNLTNHPIDDDEPVWAPDGTKIAFTSNRAQGQQVFVMNSDGSNPVRVSQQPADGDHADWGRKPFVFPPRPTQTPILPTAAVKVKCWGKAVTIVGTTGNDTIVGTEGPDVIAGLGGKDTIRGLGGNDHICGTGKIRIEGGDGDDRLQGSRGDDRLKGGDGDDRIEGGRGDDRLEGGDGNDHLGGGPDTDRIYGGSGKDKLYGGSGTYDLCKGGRGYDKASEGCQKKTGIQDDIDD